MEARCLRDLGKAAADANAPGLHGTGPGATTMTVVACGLPSPPPLASPRFRGNVL
jgi:hypothetical protein